MGFGIEVEALDRSEVLAPDIPAYMRKRKAPREAGLFAYAGSAVQADLTLTVRRPPFGPLVPNSTVPSVSA